jgi:hypothetical protein
MSYVRAVRWRFLLRGIADVPRRSLLAVSWIGFAAIMLLPFRIGELARPYMLRARGGDPKGPNGGKISMTAATSSVLAERFVDGLFLGVVLAVALVFVPTIAPLPDHVVGLPPESHITVKVVRLAGYAMPILFGVLTAAIAVFYFARTFSHRMTIAILGRVSRPFAEKVAGVFEKFAHGLTFLGHGKDTWGFVVETGLYWFFNALGMWILAWGCGVVHGDGSPITFGETCALMGMLGAAILIPGPPAAAGLFQLGICAGMTMYFPESIINGPGAAFYFLLYLIQFVWTCASGGAFLVDRKNLRALEEAEGMVPPAPETTAADAT